jgi:hypothetical protein
MTKQLTTFLGQPIEPHTPSGVEALQYYCLDCGHEVGTEDGEYWFHMDPDYDLED